MQFRLEGLQLKDIHKYVI